MVTLYAVPLGIALGLLLGGRVGRLAELQIRGSWLLYVAFALQLAAFPTGLFPWSVSHRLATGLWLVSFGCLAVAALRNIRLRGAALTALGMLSNLVAVLANAGAMPMTERARIGAGLTPDEVVNNSKLVAHPHLPWLVDRFAAPHWLPAANVFSVGDVLIVAGAILLVAAGMGARVRLPFRLPALSR